MSNEVDDDPIDGALYTVMVNIKSVTILDNPQPFLDPIQFEISLSCSSTVEHYISWKVIYVGCPEDGDADQCLDSVVFEGPIPVGNYRFIWEVKAPDPNQIPKKDLRGPSVIMLQCSFREQVFYHRGYFLNNEYVDEKLIQDPPENVDVGLLQRNILSDHAVIITTPIKITL